MYNNHYIKWLQQFKIYMRNLLNYPRLCVLLASILFKSFCLQHISLVALLRLASFPSPPFAKSAINFIANHFLAAFLGHFVNMMFSLVAPLLLLLLPALLMRLFAVIADENIFNLLYAIEWVGGRRRRGRVMLIFCWHNAPRRDMPRMALSSGNFQAALPHVWVCVGVCVSVLG